MPLRIIRRGEDPPADNTICGCPCGCGREPANGAVMCSTCAAELCKHEKD